MAQRKAVSPPEKQPVSEATREELRLGQAFMKSYGKTILGKT